jgi:hypothetical protein
MLREVKGAVLRDCEVHIWFCLSVTGRSYGCARLVGVLSGRFMIDATVYRCAPLFEVGDPRFAGRLPCKD